MSVLITVDGIEYGIRFQPGGLKRKAEIKDGPNGGQSRAGTQIHDTIGTYFHYQLELTRDADNVTEYDALYEVLTDPAVRDHTFILPYGQSTIEFEAFVTDVQDGLKKRRDGVNKWGPMVVDITMTAPYREA